MSLRDRLAQDTPLLAPGAYDALSALLIEQAGFSGMLFTEGHQVPWMNIAAASLAAPSLHFSTGIAIAFARSPMVSAEIAWELAQNTRGKFRLGLGSQVKAHIERRYASQWDKPAPQMKDYVQAVKACLAAFRREAPLKHDGRYYKMNLLPEQWTPPPFDPAKDTRVLMAEAAEAGDFEEVCNCTKALRGNRAAIVKCAITIDDARAMDC